MRFRDGDWVLIDHAFETGRTTWARNNGDGTSTYRTDYPVTDTIEANLTQRNMAESNWNGDYHHVASIPPGVFWDKLAEASRQGDDAYISKFLNDGDNRAWRTKDGRV